MWVTRLGLGLGLDPNPNPSPNPNPNPNPHQVLHVGDDLHNDFLAARACGQVPQCVRA
jgi:FMN phosphatase YigB (HAD superfamily)